MSLTEFFHMGGYAIYVWSSYGLALLVLMMNLILPIIRRRKLIASFARRERREHREQRQKAANQS
jgi:heme exporter protein D